jgi:uncharacterized protein YheU (UPF0270 family)
MNRFGLMNRKWRVSLKRLQEVVKDIEVAGKRPGLAGSCKIELSLRDSVARQRDLAGRGEAGLLWRNVVSDTVEVRTNSVRRQSVCTLVICRQG